MASVFSPTRASVKTIDELFRKHNMLVERMDYHASPVINGGGFGDVKSPIVPGVIDDTVVLYDGISGKRIKASTIYANWFDQAVTTTSDVEFATVGATQFYANAPDDDNYALSLATHTDAAGAFTLVKDATVKMETWTFSAGNPNVLASTVDLVTGNHTIPSLVANTTVTANTVVLPTVFNDQIEPTGCYDRTATLAFVDGTRTFTITGDHIIYRSGEKRTMPTASLVISNVQGNHYIYYNSSWELTETTTLTTFAEPYVAVVYWNSATSKGLLADERHGIVMDASTQEYLHNSVGTRYISGFAASFADASFTMGTGVIMDEDYKHTIAETSSCLVFYKNGSASYEWDVSTDVYYKLVTGSLQYNNGNTLTPVDANKYVAAWIFATNVPDHPIFALVGQRQDTLLADARANNDYNSLSLADLPFREFKILYRVILRNDGTPYVETSDMRNVSQFGTSATVISAHNALTGLDYATAGHTGFLPDTAIDDTAYGVGWNGDTTHTATKNALYDIISTLGSGAVSDEAYGVAWNGVTDVAPSKNAVYDAISGLPATHDAVTINATANGLSISGQELSLALSSTSTTGALSDTDWDTFNGKQDALTFGIADTNTVKIDSASVADDEYARFTASGLESRSTSEVLSDIGALSTGHLTDFTHSDIAHTNRSDLDLVSGTNTGDQDLSGYALKSNVLELDNTTPFTPDADYEPATKKYVDDNAGGSGHDPVTINATANGLSIVGQELALALASTSTIGALSDTDWNTFNGKQAALTFGIADTNAVKIDAADVADNDFAKFTATGLEGRSASEVLSDIGAAASSHAHDSLTNSNTGDPVVKLWTGTQSEYDAIGTGNYNATTLYTITDEGALPGIIIDDTAYGASWNGDTTHIASKNAIYDKIETLGTGGGAPVTIWGYM